MLLASTNCPFIVLSLMRRQMTFRLRLALCDGRLSNVRLRPESVRRGRQGWHAVAGEGLAEPVARPELASLSLEPSRAGCRVGPTG